MWFKKKHQAKNPENKKEVNQLPKQDVPIEEIRRVIHLFSDKLPNGVELQTIINEDLTINYELLAPYLEAIPNQTYYMSKETYEIFEEKDYQLALDMDHIQRAVDKYIKQTGELPIIDDDSNRKVNYFKLDKLGLISYRPNRDFYITEEEFLITYEKQKK